MINIAELLKSAPKDLKLYSPICGHCKLSCILYDDGIRVIAHDVPFRFDKYGRFCSADDAECLLFPSKDCRTWEGWKLPVEPKFKVGDEIKTGNTIDTIAEVDHATRRYYCESGRTISFANQDLWHLAPEPHYDIANFYAGMPVLVRDDRQEKWCYALYSHYDNEDSYQFVTAGHNPYIQCIPFEGNEHLLGTTNMPSEEYINW